MSAEVEMPLATKRSNRPAATVPATYEGDFYTWNSIAIHREQAAEVLDENPGLKPRAGEALDRAYRKARLEAIAETGLRASAFPERCPDTSDEVLSRPYELEF